MRSLVTSIACLALSGCMTPPYEDIAAHCAADDLPEKCEVRSIENWQIRRAAIADSLGRMGQAMRDSPAPQSGSPVPHRGSPGIGSPTSYVDGMNRICLYNTIRGQEAVTIGAAQICPQTLQRARTAPVPQSFGHFVRSYASGMNRICVYSTVQGEQITTISSTAICPLSLPN